MIPCNCCAVGQAADGTAAGAQPAAGSNPMGVSQNHMNGAGPLPQLADGILDLISPESSPVKVT